MSCDEGVQGHADPERDGHRSHRLRHGAEGAADHRGEGRQRQSPVSVLMHVPSKKAGWKDVVKVEDRELDPKEVDKISLISPKATINIIRDFNVAEKYQVRLPDVVRGMVKCGNPNCITNLNEPVEPEFGVDSKNPPVLRCIYCDRIVDDIGENLL